MGDFQKVNILGRGEILDSVCSGSAEAKVGMAGYTSLYLDLIRALAAIGVFFGHAGQGFFSTGVDWWLPNGHHMVVIFFVLSGFLMAYAVEKNGADWRAYVVARTSRIASVAYPALVLTIGCDYLGRIVHPELYSVVAREEGYWIRMLLSALFLQQCGSLAASPGSNSPFWSLSYEVWYYALFGIWVFVRPGWRRFLFLGGIVAFCLPKILLLLPVWGAGVWAYRLSGRIVLSRAMALVSTALSFGTLIAVVGGNLDLPFEDSDWKAEPPLFFSTAYAADVQLGGVFAFHLFSFDALVRTLGERSLGGCEKVIRFFSNRSFSLYAFHMPLLYLASVLIPYDKGCGWSVLLVLVGIYGCICLGYELTERRRGWVRERVVRCFGPGH